MRLGRGNKVARTPLHGYTYNPCYYSHKLSFNIIEYHDTFVNDQTVFVLFLKSERRLDTIRLRVGSENIVFYLNFLKYLQ